VNADPDGWLIPAECAGERLDRVLGDCPAPDAGIGLRGRRRLCASGRVLVDGRPAGSGHKLRAGQRIVVLPAPAQFQSEELPRLVGQSDDLAALYKPAGWHSVRLAGDGGHDSVEGFLAAVPLANAEPNFVPCLLNRLDRGTSGLLMLARTASGRERWRQAERAGRIAKRYVALVEGVFSAPLHIRRALDVAGRAKVRIKVRASGHDAADPLRHTLAAPLGALTPAQAAVLFPGALDIPPLSLALCRIRLGARHQIRAHLAAAGHPLFGDSLYGGREAPGFLLHHIRIDAPGFSAFCPPPWLARLPRHLAALLAPECGNDPLPLH
jgi:23S rRNA pseudouridine1911/1915/1917 synthase